MNLIPFNPAPGPSAKERAMDGFIETLIGAPDRGQPPILDSKLQELIQQRNSLLAAFWLGFKAEGDQSTAVVTTPDLVARLRVKLAERGIPANYEQRIFASVAALDECFAKIAEIFERPAPDLVQPTRPYDWDEQGRLVFPAQEIPTPE